MGTSSGILTDQSYAVEGDGTFSVSDSAGNAFALLPIESPQGHFVPVSLVGNSTVAVQTFALKSGWWSEGNVIVSYKEARRDCQPTGVEISVSGAFGWRGGAGQILIPFGSAPISVSGDRAWFGNSSGVALGFDWSDSALLHPSYDSRTNTISWSVGNHFAIDPVTIATSTSNSATFSSYQTRLCSANGRTWVFYFDGTNYDFASSTTGVSGSWTSPTSISTSGGIVAGGIAVACSGSQVYRAVVSTSQRDYGWWFDSGTFNSAGTISWGTEVQISPQSQYGLMGPQLDGPSVAVDTSGRIWVGIYDDGRHGFQRGIELWDCASSCGSPSSWSDNNNLQQIRCAQVIALTSGKLAVVYDDADCANTISTSSVITYDGVSRWSSPIAGPLGGDLESSQYTALGDTVEGCAAGAKGLNYSSFAYGAAAWSLKMTLDPSSSTSCAVSTDGKSIVAITETNAGGMKSLISTTAGYSWSNAIVLDPPESSSGYMSGPLTFSANTISAVYESGAGSPYSVRYFAWPITMPTAANTKYSWGKLGLSPYQSYFQNFGEFLSSGNGLLTLVMGTASVPSRGLNLETGLVYTNPYTFRPSGSVYQFENFTLAHLGAGWSLDLPWLGPNFVHMPGGEAILYSWGSCGPGCMIYQGDTDFTLRNLGANGYTLALKDGTVYNFDSSQLLRTEYDRTGKNSLTFAYNGNTCLTSITDSLGRQITLGCDANRYITSITSAGRVWTLGYSSTTPEQLTTVTDPLNRVTSFQYAGTSGANLWLLNAILYPSNGKTAYTYTSMSYGTEANYYFVNSRSIYSSSQLVRSDSLSYTTLNSQFVWSNMTSADGNLNVQGYTRTNYNTAAGTQKVYDLNSAGSVFRITENDYDGYGRVATTKQESPSGKVLATSISSFDLWGNTVYTKDFGGQQTYYSYANSDAPNLFTNSSVAYQGSVIPIAIANYQNSATPNPFQEGITIYPSRYSAYESSTLGNIRFCADKHCSTKLYAWLESCAPSCSPSAVSAIVWVKLSSSIPAGSQTTIWMNFSSTSTNFDGNYWGEAPTLSATYGQYDNGANVFNLYDNFAGSTLNPRWTNNGVSVYVSNAAQIFPSGTTASFSRNTITLGGTNYYNSATVFESFLADGQPTSNVDAGGLWVLNSNSASAYSTSNTVVAGSDLLRSGGGSDNEFDTPYQYPSGTSNYPYVGFVWGEGTPYVLSLYLDGSGNSYGTVNYANGPGSNANYNPSSQYLGIGLWSQDTEVVAYWARVRTYPVGGVMPSAYVGYFGVQGCSSAFYPQAVSGNIHDLQIGKCDLQNGAGSAQQATFYNYDFSGNLIEQKTSHNGGWIYTDYGYDVYGNKVFASLPSSSPLVASCSSNSPFGTGADGSVTFTTSQTIPANAKQYANVTIDPGVTLTGAASWKVCGTLTNYGAIVNLGTPGADGTLGGANDGGTYTCVGQEGSDGLGSNNGGGGGAWFCNGAGGIVYPGSGGTPGGSGGGGGTITLTAFRVNNLGIIRVDGGRGGNGGSGTGGTESCSLGCAVGGGGAGGGGNGGPGGTITLAFGIASGFGVGTLSAYGGPAGQPGSPGAGYSVHCTQSAGALQGGYGWEGGQGGSTSPNCVGNAGATYWPGNSGSSGTITVTEIPPIVAGYTYYAYSSTYSSAYLTKQSILVGTQNVSAYYSYDSAKGFKLSQTDPNGQTTKYRYDVLGRPTSVTYPTVNGVTAFMNYTYDDTRNIMTITGANGNVVKARFDGLGRETSVARTNGSLVYSNQTYTYNWLNLVASMTTAAGHTYTYSYDSVGRETKITNPDTTYSTTSYDDVNNLKTVTDENAHQTIYTFDWNNRLTSVKLYNSSSNYFLTTYGYDLSGNLLSVTDAKNQQTSYQYDDLNRLVTTTFPTSPTTTETRTYDSSGNMLTKTTANNSLISYNYDALNRLTKITYPGSGGTVTIAYNPDGNKLSMINPSVSTYYAYDARERLTNQTQVVAGAKYQTLYTYDKASDVLSIKYPDSYVLSMTYDALNRLKTVGSFATIKYTVDDRVNKITYGDGEVSTYTYDSRDRPTRILDVKGGTHNLDLNYTYDGTGNILKENTQSYGYDWLNRLTSSSGPWATITYYYDQVGNRVKMVQGATKTVYTYGSFNRLTKAGTTTYTYDANGNMVTKNDGTAWTFTYDYENRLTKVVHSGSTVQKNFYDGNGSRIEQVAGSSTFVYSYRGLNMLYEKNTTSGVTTVTKHFYAGNLQVAKMVGTGTYYLHQDILGSTRLVVTSSLSVKFKSNYVPYGPNYALTGKEVFMYVGKPYDKATGLYYFGARFYDTATGRFVTQDSHNGTKTDPLSQNKYIYARDNPMKYVDPNGHDFVTFFENHISTFVDIIFNIMAIINGAFHLFEEGIKSAAASVFWGLVSAGQDLSSFAQAIKDQSPAEIINTLWTFTYDVVSTWWSQLDFWTQLWAGFLTVVFGVGTVLTVDAVEEINFQLSIIGLAVDFTNLFLDAAAGW